MAALFYAIVGDAGCEAPPPKVTRAPDAEVVVKPTPLPPIELRPVLSDAGVAVDEDTITRAQVERLGLLGRYSKWVDELLGDDPNWQPVAEHEDRTIWRNGNNVVVTFRIEHGRVAAMDSAFDDKSLSADMTALSGLVVGNHSAIPLHWEELEAHGGEVRSGDFELEDGRVFFYRGRVRTEGQEPFGPESFELRATPFP